MNKKAKAQKIIWGFLGIFMVVIITGIIITLSGFVLGNIQKTQTANSTEQNITKAITEGLSIFSEYFPPAYIILGCVFLVVIILVILFMFAKLFSGRK